MSFSNKKGFTLIELLIVIAIIGILAVAFLPSLLDAPAKGRDAQRMASVQKIQNFLVTQTLAGKPLPDSGCIDSAGAADTIGKLINDNVSDFGGVYPLDPQSDATKGNKTTGAVPECIGKYGYVKFSSGNYTAGIYAAVEKLENANAKCNTIKAATPPTLGKVASLGAGEVGCYAVLLD